MGMPAENLAFDDLSSGTGPGRLARLVMLPALPDLSTARERLDAALGPELAEFLVMALSAAQSR
ncbi:MAG TPA: hypothetical protein VGM80_12705 [Gaiellaceae bacterium]